MELFKLENGRLRKYKEGFAIIDNKIYTNPTEEIVRKAGYKDLVYGDKPEYDEETQHLNEVYTEDDTTIQVDYEVVDNEVVEE